MKFKATVDYYTGRDGMVTLVDGDWYGEDRIPFSKDLGFKKGDEVEIEVSGGRKAPVIQSMKALKNESRIEIRSRAKRVLETLKYNVSENEYDTKELYKKLKNNRLVSIGFENVDDLYLKFADDFILYLASDGSWNEGLKYAGSNGDDGAKYEHGFDHTSFDSPDDWVKVLKAAGITNLKASKGEDGFDWTGKGISIRTGNDPITGNYFRGKSPNEPGFASYIGLTGDKGKVMAAVKTIKSLASYIKDESPGTRDFI